MADEAAVQLEIAIAAAYHHCLDARTALKHLRAKIITTGYVNATQAHPSTGSLLQYVDAALKQIGAAEGLLEP